MCHMVFVRIFLTESVSFIKLDILKYLGKKDQIFCSAFAQQ